MSFDSIVDIFSSLTNPALLYFILPAILVLCGFGLPLPEDIILITGGYLAYLGIIDLWIFIPLAFIGVLGGDSAIFLLGRKFGYSLLSHRYFAKFLTEKRLAKTEMFMAKYHDKFFFAARFLPGLRATIYFAGGALKAKFWKFFLYDSIAALLSVPVWILGAYYGGEYINSVIKFGKSFQIIIFLAIIIIALVFVLKQYGLFKKKSCR
jgi:membrane protein DedA with SNARE-associated domain